MPNLEMDNGMGRGSFYAVLALYRRQAYIVIGVGLLLGLGCGYEHFDIAAALLVMSAILAWLFVTWLSICYERYLQTKYAEWVCGRKQDDGTIVWDELIGPSNYTRRHQALTETLAFFAAATFIVGLIAMTINLMEM
jgi:phosphatidylglycerophosphatase A